MAPGHGKGQVKEKGGKRADARADTGGTARKGKTTKGCGFGGLKILEFRCRCLRSDRKLKKGSALFDPSARSYHK
jgi:hypothetical protein